jgi:hypothetical protein
MLSTVAPAVVTSIVLDRNGAPWSASVSERRTAPSVAICVVSVSEPAAVVAVTVVVWEVESVAAVVHVSPDKGEAFEQLNTPRTATTVEAVTTLRSEDETRASIGDPLADGDYPPPAARMKALRPIDTWFGGPL